MNHKLTNYIITAAIIIAAFLFRSVGFNWDQGHHLHPDERFLTMVVPGLNWPSSLGEYLDPATSPANPHNTGNSFFVYGTFPLLLAKFVAGFFGMDNYDGLLIIGRLGAAFLDTVTVLPVILITREISKNRWQAFWSGFFYTTLALPIQLSHFFAVDPLLTLITALSIYTALKGQIVRTAILAGTALSVKISAGLYLPIPLSLLVMTQIRQKFWTKPLLTFLYSLAGLILMYLTLRLLYPYAFADGHLITFTPNPKLLNNFRELSSFNDPSGWFPPAVQWIATKPILFPFLNLFYFGTGIFHGSLLLIGIALTFIHFKKNSALALMTLVSSVIFVYQGSQFVKALRYFYPLYPIFSLVMAYPVALLIPKLTHAQKTIMVALIIACSLVWPAMVASIYTRTHTRVAASEWIYDDLPPGSARSVEHWDDGLPLTLDAVRNHDLYQGVEYPLFGPDTEEKSAILNDALNRTDYLILSSNRLYGALTSLPEKYPDTTAYYRQLFSEELGYRLAAQFTSRPNLPIPFIRLCIRPPFLDYGIISQSVEDCPLSGISVIDDYADETWTVYDHPKVLIFSKE